MFDLVLLCDERKVYDGQVSEVYVTTCNGPTSIRKNHQPYMSKIVGQVTYATPDGSFHVLDIADGFVYTNGLLCHVVVDITS
ncbi:MAG: hypothetical protein LBF56_03170 [Holosporales bacterium]|jgi:F0F1-type ATP synthase epsilon subunit|nr:hypothetical protein [Holosporales bacterium]